MKIFPVFFLATLQILSSCAPKEEEEGVDYENMVMVEEGWENGEDHPAIIEDFFPNPQEIVLSEPSDQAPAF